MSDGASSPAKAIASEATPKGTWLARVRAALLRRLSRSSTFTARTLDELRVRSWGMWDEPALIVLHDAFREAAVRGHPQVQVGHLVLALLRDPEVSAFLQHGVDVSAISSVTDDDLSSLAVEPLTRASCGGAVTRILEATRVHAAGAGRTTIRPGDLLVQLPRADARATAAFVRAGFSFDAFLIFLSHGEPELPPPDAAAPDGDELEVWLHNDDYTTQELVVDVLQTSFGLDPTDAVRLMVEVHTTGAARVATLPRDEAIRAVQAAYDRLRTAGAPLKITLEPASLAGPPAPER